jgi:sua5/yciO/yrdC/ywlC family protein
LVAPSANPSGEEPAKNVAEAINYFHELVPIYVDSGEVANTQPSQIVRINEGGEIEFLRR